MKKTQTYYSIRTVKATSKQKATERVKDGFFDETQSICDKVLTKKELLIELKKANKRKPEKSDVQLAKELLAKKGYIVGNLHCDLDIIEQAKNSDIKITKRQVKEVIQYLENKFDNEQGINYYSIQYAIELVTGNEQD